MYIKLDYQKKGILSVWAMVSRYGLENISLMLMASNMLITLQITLNLDLPLKEAMYYTLILKTLAPF